MAAKYDVIGLNYAELRKPDPRIAAAMHEALGQGSTPGGYDQSIASALSRPESIAGFKVIAISRPGYLRTPLQSGVTPAEQADVYAALLDELNIKTTIVYGASGGAPSALRRPARGCSSSVSRANARADDGEGPRLIASVCEHENPSEDG